MPIEQSLLQALVELEKAVSILATANPKPDLGALFQRIDDLSLQLPLGTDPQLRHFLQRKSYAKARLFLEGNHGEISAGNCTR